MPQAGTQPVPSVSPDAADVASVASSSMLPSLGLGSWVSQDAGVPADNTASVAGWTASRAESMAGDTETELGEEVVLTSDTDALFRADYANTMASLQQRHVKTEVAPAANVGASPESRFNMTAAEDEACRASMSETAIALCRSRSWRARILKID